MARTPAGSQQAAPASRNVLPIEILTRDELDRLYRSCSRRAPSGLRDAALIALLHGAGLRVAEALALLPRDLDLEKGAVTVRRGKGNKRRVSGIDQASAAIVQRWLDRRSQLGAKRSHPVICQISAGKVGLPVQQPNVRQMLKRRAAKAGIDKRVHAHGLRHSHAAELANDGLPIHVVQAQLGHSNAATTSRYIAHLNPADVIRAVRNRPSVQPAED